MAKNAFTNDPRLKELLDLVEKFHDDQDDNADKLHIKRIVVSLAPNAVNPCNGFQCADGKHPEIFIHPKTGEVSCRCVR